MIHFNLSSLNTEGSSFLIKRLIIDWSSSGIVDTYNLPGYNKKSPNEALKYDESNINEIASHYEYIMDHMEIVQKIGH